jgi:multidrug transporter EmrE-like cation transporter
LEQSKTPSFDKRQARIFASACKEGISKENQRKFGGRIDDGAVTELSKCSSTIVSSSPKSVKMKKSMPLFYFSITLAICSSALYHFTAKSTPANVNFTVSLLVTYAVAFAVVLLTFFFFPIKNGLAFELKQLNWASIGLAIAIVGIEFGFLLVYRSGWNLGIAAVLTNVVASLILLPVAIFFFKDKISWVNIVGIFVCLAGLIMLNWKS